MPADRTKIAIAVLGSAMAMMFAALVPTYIPALTLGLAAWIALSSFLEL